MRCNVIELKPKLTSEEMSLISEVVDTSCHNGYCIHAQVEYTETGDAMVLFFDVSDENNERLYLSLNRVGNKVAALDWRGRVRWTERTMVSALLKMAGRPGQAQRKAP